MRRDIGDARAGLGLRAVAVMVVEIGDQHASLAAALRLIGARGHDDVVEEAEAHAARWFGVVARRPNEREDGLTERTARLHGSDGAACGAARGAKRVHVDERIAGREVARADEMLGLAAQQLEITRRVHALELLVARVARAQGLRQNAAGA